MPALDGIRSLLRDSDTLAHQGLRLVLVGEKVVDGEVRAQRALALHCGPWAFDAASRCSPRPNARALG